MKTRTWSNAMLTRDASLIESPADLQEVADTVVSPAMALENRLDYAQRLLGLRHPVRSLEGRTALLQAAREILDDSQRPEGGELTIEWFAADLIAKTMWMLEHLAAGRFTIVAHQALDAGAAWGMLQAMTFEPLVRTGVEFRERQRRTARKPRGVSIASIARKFAKRDEDARELWMALFGELDAMQLDPVERDDQTIEYTGARGKRDGLRVTVTLRSWQKQLRDARTFSRAK